MATIQTQLVLELVFQIERCLYELEDKIENILRKVQDGNGDPPTPLTQSEASKEIRVGNTITTRGVARAKELEILETLVEAVSEERPIPGQMRDQREAAVRFWDWLNQTEPLSDCPTSHRLHRHEYFRDDTSNNLPTELLSVCEFPIRDVQSSARSPTFFFEIKAYVWQRSE